MTQLQPRPASTEEREGAERNGPRGRTGVTNESARLDAITERIIGSAIEVHRTSYLKATGRRVGLLINFNVRVLKAGIRRVAR